MSSSIRFGRKIPMPSTIEIKHDLRLMETADAVLAARAGDAPGARGDDRSAAIVDDLIAGHGLPRDRAVMLVARFGIDREALEGAARDLRAGEAR